METATQPTEETVLANNGASSGTLVRTANGSYEYRWESAKYDYNAEKYRPVHRRQRFDDIERVMRHWLGSNPGKTVLFDALTEAEDVACVGLWERLYRIGDLSKHQHDREKERRERVQEAGPLSKRRYEVDLVPWLDARWQYPRVYPEFHGVEDPGYTPQLYHPDARRWVEGV